MSLGASRRGPGLVGRIYALLLRELLICFFSPLAWVVLTLFLLVQGYGFYLIVELRNQPQGPQGPLLQYLFGGTFFYWLFIIVVVALLTMRLIAEERRHGTLEVLLAAPVREAEVVLGKFLSVLLFYVFLWLPTLVYMVLAHRFAGPAGLDPGMVAGGYLGTLLCGAAALAIGLGASALARNQVVAALITFTLLTGFLLLGPLELFVEVPWIRHLASYCNIFEHMEDFARGIVDSRHLVLYLSIGTFGLVAAVTALRGPRRRGPRAAARTGLGLALLAVNLVLANTLAARHPHRADWTAGHVHSLSPATETLVRSLHQPLRITLFMVPPARLETSLFRPMRELVTRLAALNPRVEVEVLDVDASPTRAELLTRRFSVGEKDLRHGLLVLELGGRTRFVAAEAMAAFDYAASPPRLLSFHGEAAVLSALRSLRRSRQPSVCFTTGHGEADPGSYEEGGYGFIADEVRREGLAVQALDPRALQGGHHGCTLLIMGGPNQAFIPAELDALDRHLEAGGRLLLLAGPVLDRRVTRHHLTGLEERLLRWGIELRTAIVVDRLQVPGEQPLLTFAVRDGYSRHPSVRALAGRVTVWPLTREVRPRPSAIPDLKAEALIRSTDEGWAELDLGSLRGERPLFFDPSHDSPGPVSIAVAASVRNTRLVVLGSERGVLNRRLSGAALRDFNRDLFMGLVGWLCDDPDLGSPGPQPGAQALMPILEPGTLRTLFLLTVVAMPLCALTIGLYVTWRRRR